jgi:hypothetical protein
MYNEQANQLHKGTSSFSSSEIPVGLSLTQWRFRFNFDPGRVGTVRSLQYIGRAGQSLGADTPPGNSYGCQERIGRRWEVSDC